MTHTHPARALAEKIALKAVCAYFDCGDSGHHAVTENDHKRMERFAVGLLLPYATALLAAKEALQRVLTTHSCDRFVDNPCADCDDARVALSTIKALL